MTKAWRPTNAWQENRLNYSQQVQRKWKKGHKEEIDPLHLDKLVSGVDTANICLSETELELLLTILPNYWGFTKRVKTWQTAIWLNIANKYRKKLETRWNDLATKRAQQVVVRSIGQTARNCWVLLKMTTVFALRIVILASSHHMRTIESFTIEIQFRIKSNFLAKMKATYKRKYWIYLEVTADLRYKINILQKHLLP